MIGTRSDFIKFHLTFKYYFREKHGFAQAGFPPSDIYEAVIIGAEPGPKAKGLMTPAEYKKQFMPGTKNKNRVRLLFEDLESAGLPICRFFYTNAVKCPSKPKGKHSKSRKCFQNCEAYLKKQLTVIKPKLLIVFGSAATLLRLKRAKKDTIERDKYMGIPAIVIRHPQAAPKDYQETSYKAYQVQSYPDVKISGLRQVTLCHVWKAREKEGRVHFETGS